MVRFLELEYQSIASETGHWTLMLAWEDEKD